MGHRPGQLRNIDTNPAQYVCIVQARHPRFKTERDYAITPLGEEIYGGNRSQRWRSRRFNAVYPLTYYNCTW